MHWVTEGSHCNDDYPDKECPQSRGLRRLNATQLSAEPFGRFAPAVDGHLVLGVPLHQVRAGAWKKQVRHGRRLQTIHVE